MNPNNDTPAMTPYTKERVMPNRLIKNRQNALLMRVKNESHFIKLGNLTILKKIRFSIGIQTIIHRSEMRASLAMLRLPA